MTTTPETGERRCFMCGASSNDVQLTRGMAGHILCMDENECIERYRARIRERASRPLEVRYYGKDDKPREVRSDMERA